MKFWLKHKTSKTLFYLNDPADVVGVDVVVDGPLGKFVPLVGRSGKTFKYFNFEKKVNLKVFYTVTTLYKYYSVEESLSFFY